MYDNNQQDYYEDEKSRPYIWAILYILVFLLAALGLLATASGKI